MFAKAWSSYLYYLTYFVELCTRAFGRLGRLAVKRTLLLTLGSLIVILLPFIGILNFRTESRGDKLWIPQKSDSLSHRSWVQNQYGTAKGLATFLVKVKSNQQQFNGNVLQLAVTDEIFQLDAAIRSLEASKNGRQYKFADLCYKDTDGSCLRMGYLNFWNMSRSAFLTSVGGTEGNPNQGSQEQILKSINVQRFPDGSGVSTLSIFAGVQFAPTHPPAIVSAKAIQMMYPLDQKASDSGSEAWLKKFLKFMKEQKKKTTYITVEYYTSNSVDLEIARSVTADMYLIAISITVFILVAVLALIKRDSVGSRASLAFVGLLGAILAILSGYGLSLGFGQPFTSLQQTLPYILGGVAIDIMLVMVKGLDDIMLASPDLTMVQRFEKMMSGPGLSVFVTTLASACAFALGTVSALPSIAWFSAYATISVLAILFVQVTFFVAIFVYNERRIAAKRLDCLCCVVRDHGCLCCCGPSHARDRTASSTSVQVTSKTTHDSESSSSGHSPESTPMKADVEMVKAQDQLAAPQQQAMGHVPASDTALKIPVSGDQRASNTHYTGLSRFIYDVYAPTLLRRPVKAAVILIFTAYLVLSCIAIDRLKEGQPLEDVCPDDSWVIPYLKLNKETFDAQTGSTTGVYFRDIPFEEPKIQARMLAALSHTLDNRYVNVTLSAFSTNWLVSFTSWAATRNVTLDTTSGCVNPFVDRPEIKSSGQLGEFLSPQQLPGCVPADVFYPLFKEWISDPSHEGFKQYIVMGADGKLASTKFEVVLKSDVGDDKYGRMSLEATKKTTKYVNKKVFNSKKEVFFLYNFNFIFGEGDAILKDMTFEYIGLAVVGVGFVLLIMLVHPTASLLMMIAVLLVDLYLFGEMWILGIRFNSVSTINLIMSTGLAVDYSVYIASKFMTTPGETRDERVRIALTETGTAVLLGAFAALCGSIPLAFTSSVILRTFFSLLFGTILFSGLVGLVLMPVLFSLVGPAALRVGISAH